MRVEESEEERRKRVSEKRGTLPSLQYSPYEDDLLIYRRAG